MYVWDDTYVVGGVGFTWPAMGLFKHGDMVTWCGWQIWNTYAVSRPRIFSTTRTNNLMVTTSVETSACMICRRHFQPSAYPTGLFPETSACSQRNLNMNTNKLKIPRPWFSLTLSSISLESCSQLAKGPKDRRHWRRGEDSDRWRDPSLSCNYPWSFLFIDFRMTEEQVERNPAQEGIYTPPFLHPMTCTSRTTNERRSRFSEWRCSRAVYYYW